MKDKEYLIDFGTKAFLFLWAFVTVILLANAGNVVYVMGDNVDSNAWVCLTLSIINLVFNAAAITDTAFKLKKHNEMVDKAKAEAAKKPVRKKATPKAKK